MNIYRGRTAKEFYLASLLYDAIDDQNMCAVNSLITTKGADANIVLAKKGIAPFHLAVGSEPIEFALNATKLILQHDGNPNLRSDEGLTPLHIAAAWGRLEIANLLLVSGANPELKDINKMSAWDYACEHGFYEIADLIKLFSVDQSEVLNTEKASCNLELEKLFIDDGKFIHEYVAQPLTEASARLSTTLTCLPETNTQEYVRNWCSTHTSLQNATKTDRNFDYSHASDDADSLGSSLQESIEAYPKILNFDNVTMRGDKLHQRIQAELTPPYRKLSRESGILTLPDSNVECTSELDELEKQEIHDKDYHRQHNSDYFTCSSASPKAFDKNVNSTENNAVCKILDSTMRENDLNDAKIGESLLASDNTGSELSFVTVSEWLRYTDAEEGITLFEKRLLRSLSSGLDESMRSALTKHSSGSSLPESVEYDTDSLRKELIAAGYSPGPITHSTKRVYLLKLNQLKRDPEIVRNEPTEGRVYSAELEKTINDSNWNQDLTVYKDLEAIVCKEFSSPDPRKHWREGKSKSSFTYLLLDPRITNDLPHQADSLQFDKVWKTFLASIFYVGKGKRSRPYSHLYDAVRYWRNNTSEQKICSKKIQRILDIWNGNKGVICLHIYQNTIPAEAYTREAAIISALDIKNLSNVKIGDFYGVCATWNQKQKKKLGVYLLYKALLIFLNEGERQLHPGDID